MVTLSDTAQIAIRSLLPEDRQRVAAAIFTLRTYAESGELPLAVRRVRSGVGTETFAMRVNAQLRLLFVRDEGGGHLRIVDVVTQDRLDRLGRAFGQGAAT